MIELIVIPPTHVDYAWRDGANQLVEALDGVDEITGDQLKLILARGERTLVQGTRDGNIVGWMTFRTVVIQTCE